MEEQDINKTIQSRKISVIYQNLTHEDAKQNRSTESLDDLKDEVKQKVENLDQLTVEDKKQGIMARISMCNSITNQYLKFHKRTKIKGRS